MPDSQRNPHSPRQRQKQPERKTAARRQVVIACPGCGTRFQAPLRKDAYETPCLTCDRPVVVAGVAETSPGRPEPDARKAPARRAAAPRKERNRQNVFHRAAAEHRDDPTPELPLLPFLSAVSFPWYPEVLLRWLFLSAGCSAVVFLFVVVSWCMSMGGMMARAGYALGFPFGWLSIWTFSYLAASSTVIITETAAGSNRISGWPEPDWREWFWEMLRYVPSLAAAASLAYGAAHLTLLLWDSYWPAALGTFFLLTPILLLSVLDSGSMLTLGTPLILSSLYLRWWGWLRFYATCAALAVLWPGTLIAGYLVEPFYSALVTGPLMAAVLLIYARLLGRLGQAITA